METLPDGFVQNELGQKVYNPLEAVKRAIGSKSDLQKNRVMRGERVVDDVQGLVERVETLEAKVKTLAQIVAGHSDRLDVTE